MIVSILDGTKKSLGIDKEYKAFDHDIQTHINAVFATLTQLGVGPSEGFLVQDEFAEWGDFLGTDPRLNNVQTYVYLRVRLLFDPPPNSFTISAIQEQIKEMEWRLVEQTAPPVIFTDEPLV